MTSVTAAYRRDLAANECPFGEQDGAWLLVASMVERAAECAPGEDRRRLRAAAKAAADVLGDVDERSRWEFGATGRHTGNDVIVLLASEIHGAGARHLAVSLVESSLRVIGRDRSVTVGRLLAQRARSAYMMGALDLADEYYDQVRALGKALGRVELEALADVGVIGVSQSRGNYPRLLAAARDALNLSDSINIPRLQHQARYGMVMGLSLFGMFSEALVYGWEMVGLAQGRPVDEAFALSALGQLCLDMGDKDSARAAFMSVVTRRLPLVIHLAALGGLARTTTSASDRSVLDWVIAEVLRVQKSVAPPYAIAMALLDCVTALRDAGRSEQARDMRDALVASSQSHGFHELRYRAELLDLDASPTPAVHLEIDGKAAEVLRSVRELEPRRLPRHVRMTTAV